MTTLQDIKNHMLNFLETFKVEEGGYYDDDGHCGSGLLRKIKSFWSSFKSDMDFVYVVSAEWASDDLDLDGGRDYILTFSRVKPLLFDYMKNTLNWNKKDYEKIIYNSLTFTEDLVDMFGEEIVEEVKEESFDFQKVEELVFIPKFVKYKSKVDNNNLNFLSESRLDKGGFIYEIKNLGCKIPAGFEIVLTLDKFGF